MKKCMFLMVVFLGVFGAWTSPASGQNLKLAASDRYWPRFYIPVTTGVVGILHDIVKKAVESLEIEAIVEPVPLRRAIVSA